MGTKKKKEAPEKNAKQIRRMPQIFDASNHSVIRNGGGGDKDINKCTTNGRPQHMYRCCAGVKDAGEMPACRHVFICLRSASSSLSRAVLRRLPSRREARAADMAAEEP